MAANDDAREGDAIGDEEAAEEIPDEDSEDLCNLAGTGEKLVFTGQHSGHPGHSASGAQPPPSRPDRLLSESTDSAALLY
jgi:hypothetical protein